MEFSTIGNTLNQKAHTHYYKQTTETPSRASAPLDFLGNTGYFTGRGVVRVFVLAKRFFCSLGFGAVHLYNLAKKNPTAANQHSLKKEAKLTCASALRLVTPIAQIVLTVVGSIGKALTSGDWQKNSVRLLCLAHSIDAQLDQWEWDIDHKNIPISTQETPQLGFPMTEKPFPSHPNNNTVGTPPPA